MMSDEFLAEREECLRFVAIANVLTAACFLAIFALRLHLAWPLPTDAFHVPLGRDFVNTWFYGRAVFDHDPGRFYDRSVYEPMVQAVLPQNTMPHLWSYPPPFLVLAAPFGQLPYLGALAAWTLLGLGALAFAVRTRGSIWLMLAVLAAPVTIFGLVQGQISLFMAALLIVVFGQLDRRPILSGLLLSLCVIKPQAVLLMPVLLVASGRFKVLAAAAAGGAAIVAMSVAVHGLSVWEDFIRIGIPAQTAEMKDMLACLAPYSPTITAEALQAGLPAPVIAAMQVGFAGVAVGLVAWFGWRTKTSGRSNPDYEGLVVLTCSVLATPYLLVHDLVPLSTMLLIVAGRQGVIRSRSALLLMIFVPIFQMTAIDLHVHVLALLVVILAVWLVARRDDRVDVGAIPQPIGLASAGT